MWHNLNNFCYFQFVKFHFQFALEYFVMLLLVVPLAQSSQRSRLGFSTKYFLCHKNYGHNVRAPSRVSERNVMGRDARRERRAAQMFAEINETHWHLEYPLYKTTAPHYQSR